MAHKHPRRQPPPLVLAGLIAAVVVVLQALLVPLFAAPAANLAPRDLPVVVAGPAAATAALTDRLENAQRGAFDIIARPDAAAADQALRDRQAYVAFVLGPDGAALHTAPGASPAVATLVTQAAAQLGEGQRMTVVEVVPADPDDPRGAGFAAGFLPLALTSMLAGIILAFLVRGRVAKVFGIVAFGVLAGLGGAAVLQGWLGVLPGDYLLDAAAIALFAAATSATVAGLASLLGPAGVGLGALLVFLVGNPLSGVSSAPELLPQPWGVVGQWLPPGAGGALLRSTAFFDGAAAARPAWILAGYALLGLLLVLVGHAKLAERGAPGAAGRTDRASAPGGPAERELDYQAADARQAARRLGAAAG
jgi:hypothetical protein